MKPWISSRRRSPRRWPAGGAHMKTPPPQRRRPKIGGLQTMLTPPAPLAPQPQGNASPPHVSEAAASASAVVLDVMYHLTREQKRLVGREFFERLATAASEAAV